MLNYEHVKELLTHRRKAAAGTRMNRFLALHECTERYYRELNQPQRKKFDKKKSRFN